MNRRHDRLIPLELEILSAALTLKRDHVQEFYGFLIAKVLRDHTRARFLTAHGTLYKALARLEDVKLLTSRWEDPAEAARDHRPPRRLYRITSAGQAALVATPASHATHRSARGRLAPATS
jgi:PadR family transcriptional regulator PadR